MSVYSVNVYPSSTTIKKGSWYYGAYAVVDASSNCDTDVTWYSNDTSIATVNASNGYIYGKSTGTTRIYAKSKIDSTKKDYITVTVTSGTICVNSVTLNRSSISLEKGDSYTLSATVCPTNATNKTISWRSSNTSVATVSGGVVTAKARGYTYIYAEAQDGSGEYDSCYVNVTEDILVTSVTVSPSSKTMNIGNSAYLYETVCPTNATNKCVRWSSNKTSVATVNPDTGLVIAQGAGTATITATAQDGSNKKGYCTITVNAPVSVTGVEVCPTNLTMNVGNIEYLCAWISPSNAANQTVTWRSSNENVATVGLYTGKITAKKAGTTTITATTADGGYQACCVLRVINDTVTITADEGYNKVIFHSTGKVWRCINHDLVFDNGQTSNTTLIYRSNHNFYLYFDEDNWINSDTTGYKEYTDDEIKLLFAIDPYGVCDYINRVGNEIKDLEDRVAYKDDKFRLLFNREPKYFGRNLNGEWGEVSGYLEIDDVLSESETLFGGHRIWDDYAFLQALEELITVVDLVLSVVPQFKSVSSWLNTHKAFDNVVKVFSFIFGTLSDGIVSSTVDTYSPDELNGTPLSWANILVTNYMNLIEFLSETNSTPNCYARIFDYYIDNLNYDINIEFPNGETCELERIREALELSE